MTAPLFESSIKSLPLIGKGKVRDIYAVGDVIGPPALASAAYDQGRCAAAHIVGSSDVPRVEEVPTA